MGINKSLKQPRSQASTPGVHQHIPNLLLLSSFPSWFIRVFFSLCQLQSGRYIAASFLYLRATVAAAIVPFPVGQRVV